MTPEIKATVFGLIQIQIQIAAMARRLGQAHAEASRYAQLAQGISNRPAYHLPKGAK